MMAITPLNPLVRTMLTSLHGAMAKGMPMDQAMTYVKSMAQQGIAPLVDLSAMLRQFEQLKQPETRPMQTGTVRDQINMAAQARAGGLGGFQMQPTQTAPQIATQPMMSPQMTAPQMAPQASGLASLDAGAMENPRGYAGGGIVAFDEGGVSASTPPIVAANLPKPRSDQQIYDYFANIMGQGYVPAFKKQEEELEGIEKEQGIGEYAKSLQQEADLLKRQGERSLEELEADRRNLGRQEAADIAGYATKSRSALEAMAKARSAAVTRERDLEKEIRAARNEREKAAINLTKAKETAATTKSTASRARVDKYQDKLDETERTLNDRAFELRKITEEREYRTAIAGFEAASRMALAQYDRDTQIAVNEARARVEAGRGTSPDYVLGGALARVGTLTESIAKETDPAKKAAMQQELNRANAEVTRITNSINATKPKTGGTVIQFGPDGKPLVAPQSGAPAASSNIQDEANAILAAGG
jgi:hypothetical protein